MDITRNYVGDVVPNWSVFGEIRTEEFKVVEIVENCITYNSARDKNIQNMSELESQQVFNVLADYKKGGASRNEIRKENQKNYIHNCNYKICERFEKKIFHVN